MDEEKLRLFFKENHVLFADYLRNLQGSLQYSDKTTNALMQLSFGGIIEDISIRLKNGDLSFDSKSGEISHGEKFAHSKQLSPSA